MTSGQIGLRLASYQMCQSHLARSYNGLVMFDEMEDVFPSESTALGERQQKFGPHKAKTNAMLESNPVPTIWLSNDVYYLDQAYLRRFDIALELPNPPRSARKSIINRYFDEMDLPAAYG